MGASFVQNSVIFDAVDEAETGHANESDADNSTNGENIGLMSNYYPEKSMSDMRNLDRKSSFTAQRSEFFGYSSCNPGD